MKKGLSLLELVITIVVLLILTIAVILVLIDNSILDKAQNAQNKYNEQEVYNAIQKEVLNVQSESIGTNMSEKFSQKLEKKLHDKYSSSNVEVKYDDEKKQIKITYKLSERKQYEYKLTSSYQLKKISSLSKLQVGDYVKYIPDGKISATLPITGLKRQSINWQVIKNDGDKVMLISEKPIDNITLSKATGWTNGPSNIDNTYNLLYSGSKGTARNLNLDDLNEILKGDRKWGDRETNWQYYDNGKKNVPEGVRTIGQLEAKLNKKLTGRISPSSNLIFEDIEMRYYNYKKTDFPQIDEKVKNMIFKSTSYWLTSKRAYVFFSNGAVGYDVCFVDSTKVDGKDLYNSGLLVQRTVTLAGRPIVILKDNVEVQDDGIKDRTLVKNAWILK